MQSNDALMSQWSRGEVSWLLAAPSNAMGPAWRRQVKTAMLDSATDSVRSLKAARASAEAVAAAARDEAGIAARAAANATSQLADREAELSDLRCVPASLHRS